MGQTKLNEKELITLKENLKIFSLTCKNMDEKKNEKQGELWQTYSTSQTMGKQVYDSFSNEELLEVIIEIAEKLEYSPAQREIFWVYREYIKKRFLRWPYALKEADLASSAGKGGKSLTQSKMDNARLEQLQTIIRDKAMEIGKIPHPRDLPEICDEIRKYDAEWGKIIEAANIDSQQLNKEAVYEIDNLEPEYVELLEAVKTFAYKLRRSPIHGEMDREIKETLTKRCGSWRNALYQIGLEPVIRIKPFTGIYIDHRKEENRKGHSDSLHNCCYKMLNITETEKEDLNRIEHIYAESGEIPAKKDVDKDLRQNLITTCGSWMNVLYQFGIDPQDYYQLLKKQKTKVKKRGKR